MLPTTHRARPSTLGLCVAAPIALAGLLLLGAGCHSVAAYSFQFDGTVSVREGIEVVARPEYYGVRIKVQNRSSRPIKILWDESAFVDMEGMAHRVVHSGVKLASRAQPQLPTIVPARAHVEQRIIAADLVSYSETSQRRRWVIHDHLPRGETAKAAVGKRLRLHLVVTNGLGAKVPIAVAMRVRWSGSPRVFTQEEPRFVSDADRQLAYLP